MKINCAMLQRENNKLASEILDLGEQMQKMELGLNLHLAASCRPQAYPQNPPSLPSTPTPPTPYTAVPLTHAEPTHPSTTPPPHTGGAYSTNHPSSAASLHSPSFPSVVGSRQEQPRSALAVRDEELVSQ